MPSREIVDLKASDLERIASICGFLPDCFQKYAPTWLPDKKSCLKQIHDAFGSDRRSRVMLNEVAQPVGWIGAITDEHNWEIHPIAVSPLWQRKGIGSMLVADIEKLARDFDAASVRAGTSDETNSTSFSRIDLYNEPARAFENIDAPEDHPVNFWLKAGYTLVGVMPDEEGLGKPGIHFAKRLV